jgi:hypothetical protein
MANENRTLGVCAYCESTLPVDAALIEYESDGEQRVFAEYYSCDEPVRPE